MVEQSKLLVTVVALLLALTGQCRAGCIGPVCACQPCPCAKQACPGAASDCCAEFELRTRDHLALAPTAASPSSFECRVPGATPAVVLKLKRESCINANAMAAETSADLRIELSHARAGSPGAGGDGLCTCKSKYIMEQDWDARGGDLACGGAPFCKVCGGLRALYAACDAEPQCAGFVRYYNTNFLLDKRAQSKPRPEDLCGYLKRSLPDSATIAKLRAEDGKAKSKYWSTSAVEPEQAVRDEDKWPGMRDPAVAKDYANEYVPGKNGLRFYWQTFIKVR